jgi:transcriptional regulator with XRE-family HTH domain
MAKFSDRLRELRERAGMTQAGLAQASDLPLGSIRNYEQGQREPYWTAVFVLAKALGVTCEAFADCVSTGDDARRKPGRPRKPGAKASPAKKRPRSKS